MKKVKLFLTAVLICGVILGGLTRLYHFKNMKVTINQYFKVIYFKT